MFKNGIWQLDNILGVPFKYAPVPETTTEVKKSKPMVPQFEVIHNAGSKANDTQLNTYMKQDDYKLWHFTVDGDSITQGFSILRSGYHASDGNGPGNSTGIGIEIADVGVNGEIVYTGDDPKILKAIENAFKLMYVIDLEYPTILKKPHQYFAPSKKNCPHWILDNWGWQGFIEKYENFKPKLIAIEAVQYLNSKKRVSDPELWINNIIKGILPNLEYIFIKWAQEVKRKEMS